MTRTTEGSMFLFTAKLNQDSNLCFFVTTGDLLLLEAGPTFMQKNSNSYKYFSLLAEVENSAPPCLGMLIPAHGMLK
jgi:hypothetical protein